MKNWKKYAAAVTAAACVGAVGAGVSLAYLTESEKVINTFTVGDLDIGLTEPDWDPDDGDGENVYPGYSVYKNPTVRNITSDKNGEEPGYARLTVSIQDKDGNAITNKDALDLIKQTIRYDSSFTGTYDSSGTATGLVQGRIPGYSQNDLKTYPMVNPLFELDTERSQDNKLVFRYMGADKSGVLKVGEEATLFTNVIIPTDWNQTQMEMLGLGANGSFKLQIEAEAIQASGFRSQEEAFEALDKEIADGTLQHIER